MEAYGERQVCETLEGIREDHKQRYLWAVAHMDHPRMVLDAGCGIGYGSRLISEKADRVRSLDISAEAIEYANRFWKTDRISFAVADVHFLHFEDPKPKFDAVTCFECIEHLAIPELFLLRLREYLAPDARIFLSTPNEAVHPFYIYRNPYHFMHYTPSDLKGLLDRTGFELCELCSQDDDKITTGTDRRYLIACCKLADAAPTVDCAELEAELPKRMQLHFSRMGNELTIAGEIRNECRQVKKRLTEQEKLVQDRDKRLADAVRDCTAAKSQETLLQERVKHLTETGQVQAKRIAALEQERAKQFTLIDERQKNLERRYEELTRIAQRHEQKFGDIWRHPAFRRLARFNWVGLKCLGLLGIPLPRISRSKERPTSPKDADAG